jgi:hypothetical protein
MRIISEQEVCKLVPAARIGKTFDFRVRQALPSKTSDARSAYVSCMYSNKADGAAFFAVGLSVSYFRGADMHQNVRTYQVRSGNVGQRVQGLSDLAMYYPDAQLVPGSTAEPRSILHALDQFADGSRLVGIGLEGSVPLTDLKPIVREALRALDGNSD